MSGQARDAKNPETDATESTALRAEQAKADAWCSLLKLVDAEGES